MARPSDRQRRSPWFLVVPGALAAAFLVVPILALLIRTPWHALPSLYRNDGVLTALRLSLLTATMATGISLVLGVPLAWILARMRFPGRRLLRAAVVVPLVLPPVVAGIALLEAFGRRGVAGSSLYALTGISLPFSTAAVVMAQTFVALPFLVITVEGGLRGADQRTEEVAATLGAGGFMVLRRITLPAVAPSIAAGAVLCWARALGEFGATVTFAGAFPGRTETMPVAVYFALENDPSSAIALSLVLLVISSACSSRSETDGSVPSPLHERRWGSRRTPRPHGRRPEHQRADHGPARRGHRHHRAQRCWQDDASACAVRPPPDRRGTSRAQWASAR